MKASYRWPWWLLYGLLSGCASTAVSQARLYPVDVAKGAEGISGQLTRTCQVGDCRVQRAVLMMHDGESLEGELTLLPGGPVAADIPYGAVGDLATGATITGMGPAAQSAALMLRSTRGSTLQCMLTLSRSADHGFGHCRTQAGALLRLEF